MVNCNPSKNHTGNNVQINNNIYTDLYNKKSINEPIHRPAITPENTFKKI